jgi:hypothetical protein
MGKRPVPAVAVPVTPNCMKQKKNNASFPEAGGKTGRWYWPAWYLAVLLFLLVQILVYYFITLAFT